MITCAYCQTLVKDESRFCDNCGKPLLTADILRVVSESSSRCPKGVSAENCPGGGVPEKCRWYDKKGNKCYYITDWPPDRLVSKYTSIETEKLKPEKPDELNQLYLDLQRAYDATLDRRKTLTSQAANIMSFGGVINTVLIGLMISLATSSAAQTILQPSPHYTGILAMAAIGFFSYILTAVFSLLAFREPKWVRLPKMPDENPLDSIQYFYEHPGTYSLERIAMQLGKATDIHQETNNRKYAYLQVGVFFLLVGIIATAIGGVILLVTVG